MNIQIRILDMEDTEDFRHIRLDALLHAPKMFGSSYSAEVDMPLDFFKICLSSSTVFAAYHEQEIIALATLSRETISKISHKVTLSSVFVQPEYQNKQVATHLLQAVIDYSKGIAEQILLSVAADNHSAINLYKKLGFQSYGIEEKALKDGLEYTDEQLMKLFLS